MSKILPSQLTEKELLALLESEEEIDLVQAEIFDYNDDIVPFLSFYGITPGDTPVSKKLLYKLYKTYSKNPIESKQFSYKIGEFVRPKGDFYLLNQDNFAISQHIYKQEKTRDKTKSITYQKHFTWFIEARRVQKGSTWIEGFILFSIYKDFCRERKVNPKLGYINFHKFLKLHFPYRRLKENRALWFKIDKDTANLLTESEKNVLREARTEKKGRDQKESTGESEETQT